MAPKSVRAAGDLLTGNREVIEESESALSRTDLGAMPCSLKKIRLHIITCLRVTLLTSIGLADKSNLGDSFALDKVTKFVFVEEVRIGDDFGYEKKKLMGQTKGALAEALVNVSQQPYITDPDYPLIGILRCGNFLDHV